MSFNRISASPDSVMGAHGVVSPHNTCHPRSLIWHQTEVLSLNMAPERSAEPLADLGEPVPALPHVVQWAVMYPRDDSAETFDVLIAEGSAPPFADAESASLLGPSQMPPRDKSTGGSEHGAVNRRVEHATDRRGTDVMILGQVAADWPSEWREASGCFAIASGTRGNTVACSFAPRSQPTTWSAPLRCSTTTRWSRHPAG